MTRDECLRRAAPVLAALVREDRERQARAAEEALGDASPAQALGGAESGDLEQAAS